jgi:hypothetical protein
MVTMVDMDGRVSENRVPSPAGAGGSEAQAAATSATARRSRCTAAFLGRSPGARSTIAADDMSEPTHLEHAVLHALLDGAHPVLEALRDQLHGLAVVHRIATPTTFSTVLLPGRGAPRAPLAARRVVLDDLHADVPGLPGGAAFALFVDDGWLSRLEGTTFGGDPWPEDPAGFTLHHDDPERDLSDLVPPDP